jgi:nitrilase
MSAPAMLSQLQIASIQMVSTPVLQENLDTANRLIGQAAKTGAQLVVLPEYFCLMGLKDTDKVFARETLGSGPIQEQLAAMAQGHGIYLVAGTIPLEAQSTSKVLNTTLVFDPQGERIGRYDKIHLFGFQTTTERYEESETIEAGNTPSVLSIKINHEEWRFGLSVCYDLRFPVWARNHNTEYDILLYVANWPERRNVAWKTLLPARAIENQAYVIGVNRVGVDEKNISHTGDSMVIDALGKTLYYKEQEEDIFTVELNYEELSRVREQLPFLNDADDFVLNPKLKIKSH